MNSENPSRDEDQRFSQDDEKQALTPSESAFIQAKFVIILIKLNGTKRKSWPGVKSPNASIARSLARKAR